MHPGMEILRKTTTKIRPKNEANTTHQIGVFVSSTILDVFVDAEESTIFNFCIFSEHNLVQCTVTMNNLVTLSDSKFFRLCFNSVAEHTFGPYVFGQACLPIFCRHTFSYSARCQGFTDAFFSNFVHWGAQNMELLKLRSLFWSYLSFRQTRATECETKASVYCL